MADAFQRALEKELTKLEERLLLNPDFRRWQAVSKTIGEYEAANAVPPPPTETVEKIEPQTFPASQSETESGRFADYLERVAAEFLREKCQFMTSTRLAEELVKRGVQLRGKNPAATLSAYLSAASNIFINVKGQGYGLKEWGSAQNLGDPKDEASNSGKLSDASGVFN